MYSTHAVHFGLEVSCNRTAESFSAADHIALLNELHCAYRVDLEEKLSAMEILEYSSDSLVHVCRVWEREPQISEELNMIYSACGCDS